MLCTVVFAMPSRQWLWTLDLPPDAQVAQALAKLRSLQDPVLQSVDWDAVKIGVFGRIVVATDKIAAGDRLEIYRSLAVDPKEARRARAQRR